MARKRATLHAQAPERQLEQGLTEQITRFLLELGAGFAHQRGCCPTWAGAL